MSPRADPVTGTFQVRVGLHRPAGGHAARLHRHRPHADRRQPRDRDPGLRADPVARQPAVWVVDPATQTVALRDDRGAALRPCPRAGRQGLETGDIVVTAGVQALRPGQKVRLLGARPRRDDRPQSLGLVAVSRRSLIVYFMIVAVVAGALAFVRLGRNEDPAFTFRTMVVQAAWPGATLEETLLQVTERIERKLQEVPEPRLRCAATPLPGQTDDLRRPEGRARRPGDVPDIWYQVRKKVGDIRHTLPQGVVGPGFNDEFGDTFGIIYGFTADGFTHRELRDYVEDVRSRLLHVPDVSQDRDPRRAGRADLPRILDRAAGRARARPAGADRGAAGAERGAPGGHGADRRREAVAVSVSRRLRLGGGPAGGQFRRRRPHVAASATSPRSAAATPIRRSRCSGSTASRRSGSRSRCATGGDILALGRDIRERDGGRSQPTCRSASSRCWSPTRPARSTMRSTSS